MGADLNEVACGEYWIRTFGLPANHVSLLKHTVQKQEKTVWEYVWQWKIIEKQAAHSMLIYASWYESVLTLIIHLKCHNVILNKLGAEICGSDFCWDKSGLKIPRIDFRCELFQRPPHVVFTWKWYLSITFRPPTSTLGTDESLISQQWREWCFQYAGITKCTSRALAHGRGHFSPG